MPMDAKALVAVVSIFLVAGCIEATQCNGAGCSVLKPFAGSDCNASQGCTQVLAAGDFTYCGLSGNTILVSRIPGAVPGRILGLGDYPHGTGLPSEYLDCFAPYWDAFKQRFYPVPGNHDYMTPGAEGYFGYFGPAAGDRNKGYYSFDLGQWHFVALNTNCTDVNCDAGSAQEKWLRSDLSANSGKCTIAFMHHPAFSTGVHGDENSVSAIWHALYDEGVDVALTGHEHSYERFAPLDANGKADYAKGVRLFIVGTGGATLRKLNGSVYPVEVKNDSSHGMLALRLYSNSYEWEFLPAEGYTFTDRGAGTCH
ncbi:3',5'-cyclic adenosine monophosphate phosphodiesterase CpdA [uncultured archaeon]|nr:3',5'-cyclic adenosine monophosphate phosphodiesterase CpdA [uncultured archaeon]